MYQVRSDNDLIIPENDRQNLLTDFSEFIGSNRLKSRIVNLKELLDVLWKRNVLQTEEGERVGIIFSKYSGEILNYYREYVSRRPRTSNLAPNGELVNLSRNINRFFFHHLISKIGLILRTVIPKT